MNLKTVLSFARFTGLSAALALSACDSGEKKADEPKKPAVADEKKADEAKADAKAEEAKALADAKADAKAEEAKAEGDAKADEAKAEGDAKADEAKAEGDAKAADAKAAGDAKAEAKKADPKKGEDKKTAKADDATSKIDAKAIYDAKCKVCHGADGSGAESQKKNNIPDMSSKDWQAKHSKAAVVKAIADGVEGTKMKAFKDKLTKEEIEAVAAFVKKM